MWHCGMEFPAAAVQFLGFSTFKAVYSSSLPLMFRTPWTSHRWGSSPAHALSLTPIPISWRRYVPISFSAFRMELTSSCRFHPSYMPSLLDGEPSGHIQCGELVEQPSDWVASSLERWTQRDAVACDDWCGAGWDLQLTGVGLCFNCIA